MNCKFRIPKEVSRGEWVKKSRFHGRISFSESEKEFFIEFSKKNIPYYSDLKTLYLKEHPHFNFINSEGEYVSKKLQLGIFKLPDDWYLIANSIVTYTLGSHVSDCIFHYYICDEWEEVVGYLISSGFNI